MRGGADRWRGWSWQGGVREFCFAVLLDKLKVLTRMTLTLTTLIVIKVWRIPDPNNPLPNPCSAYQEEQIALSTTYQVQLCLDQCAYISLAFSPQDLLPSPTFTSSIPSSLSLLPLPPYLLLCLLLLHHRLLCFLHLLRLNHNL